jgi:hypothetical protein
MLVPPAMLPHAVNNDHNRFWLTFWQPALIIQVESIGAFKGSLFVFHLPPVFE